MAKGVPASLRDAALRRFYEKHDRSKLGRIPALLTEHGYELLGEKLEEKYGEHPSALWHGSLTEATALFDFPENGHPMVGPLQLQSGAIVLREGDRVCITDKTRPAPGWVMGYNTAGPAPTIGCFPIAFTSAGGQAGAKPKRRRRPRSAAALLEHGAQGERAPAVSGPALLRRQPPIQLQLHPPP